MKNTFESLMAKTPKLSYEELEKENEKLYLAKLDREANLLQAYKEKKLKSVTLLREVKKIKARRKKQKQKEKAKGDK